MVTEFMRGANMASDKGGSFPIGGPIDCQVVEQTCMAFGSNPTSRSRLMAYKPFKLQGGSEVSTGAGVIDWEGNRW
jgi:hypothetical protein